ncbi:UDP-2,3-diacylglucosamine diphosphatase [Paraglaciecola sp. 20A4]|uniref:UDP-2,3-diacylglucosamine diphosphatase n=1 Tax=Paraglaciecola sp. 20A4 TaxID=2687288 RepID=UPI001407F1B0|nr:UDP-2,3-diacylglucosamine diphosphatase [Paraglaciecola sp. 20A4]
MSFTYFIADLHLSPEREDISQCLFQFLRHNARQADALYVLGDLFEAWIGDDNQTPFNQKVASEFKHVADSGVKIYFIHGNRDFLIRERFAKQAGFTLLPEQVVVNLYGTPTLISHGDELCTRDVAYQKFRRKARGWWWPRLVLCLPLSTRQRIADNGRAASKENQKQLTTEIMDVTQQEVINTMARFNVQRLIHGHTHRPDIHDFEVNGLPAQRIVLGDWYDQGSILKVSKDKLLLTEHPFFKSAQ